MRAYTQGQQKLSAVATALGISKTSTVEQFAAAINARRQALASADEELDADPRLAQQRANLRAREQIIARAQYGDTADLAETLLQAASGGSGILELAEIVDGYVIEAATKRFGAVTPEGAGPAAPQVPQQAPPQAPERALMMEAPRGNDGMYDPGITPDREKGPAGFFEALAQKVPALRGR